MQDTSITSQSEHQLNYSKNLLTLAGVKEVLSFEDKIISLSLFNSGMIIKGENLSVGELNLKTGVLKINGHILNITYTKTQEKMSIVKKLFK